ncbi:MAG: hypothetical protein ACTHMG_13975 [Sphingomonas sp.]
MRRLACLLAVLLAANPAAARDRDDMTPLTSTETQRSMFDYSDCIVRNHGTEPAFEKMMRQLPDDGKRFVDDYVKVLGDQCTKYLSLLPRKTVQMQANPATMRDMLFAALYRRDFGKTGAPAGIATVPPLALSSEFDGNIKQLPQSYIVRRTFGDCVARHAPEAVNDLLLAKPYSRDEDEVIAALSPKLGACISKGQKISLTRDGLREDVAEAMYDLALAARAAPPAGG